MVFVQAFEILAHAPLVPNCRREREREREREPNAADTGPRSTKNLLTTICPELAYAKGAFAALT